MSVTIHDIAKLTGLNASTVSRALRHDPRISQETMHRVLRTADKLGYVMNLAARNLAAGKTRLVALIMNSLASRHQSVPASAMNEVLIEKDYTLMILLHNGTKQSLANCISKLEQKICDAAVMIPPAERLFSPQLITRLNLLKMPVCFIDRWLEATDYPAVTTDVELSIRGLVDKVMQEKTDGAFLFQSAHNTVGRARFLWESRLLSERNIPWTDDPDNLQSLVRRHKIKTLAVFADSPWTPVKVPSLFADKQPERYIGAMFDPWDNYPPDFYDRIFLCLQNFPEIGRKSAHIVLNMLRGKQPENRLMEIPPTEIMEIRGGCH